ncbi:uncharacterized protein LOC142349464 isoform X2 [Convolutriloba macropyga]|uniref:uncharacterized protein LOC142349464 isoform X2 n=1 Tax=Convolutriloba macropyga TaxID=536237 RepID=UPI003F524427
MLARRDSKNVDGKRPLSATGAVGDKLKTEPVEQVLDPGSKSLAEVLEIVSYYTYTLPSKSVTISQHTTILNKNKTITPMKSYCTFKEHPQSKDKAKHLHLSLSDTDELYSFTQSGSSNELAELSSEPQPVTDDISCTEPEGFDPVIAFCADCNLRVITTVSTERKKKAYIAFIILLVLFLWPFCIIPLLLKRCKVPVHYCSVCGSKLTPSSREKSTKCTEMSKDTPIKVTNESDSRSLEK